MGFFDPVGKQELEAAIARGRAEGKLSSRERDALERASRNSGSTGRAAKEALQRGR